MHPSLNWQPQCRPESAAMELLSQAFPSVMNIYVMNISSPGAEGGGREARPDLRLFNNRTRGNASWRISSLSWACRPLISQSSPSGYRRRTGAGCGNYRCPPAAGNMLEPPTALRQWAEKWQHRKAEFRSFGCIFSSFLTGVFSVAALAGLALFILNLVESKFLTYAATPSSRLHGSPLVLFSFAYFLVRSFPAPA
jgi:hypothetical protein